jgi:ABC-2 type transport system ATP-binding protein
MLELRNVYKRFSGIPAVEDVSFSARAGEVTGYLGPNGSGKSTTMKLITGLIELSAGIIVFEDKPIRDNLIAYKQRMGYVPEEPYLYTHQTGHEYLTMVAQLRNLPAKQSAEKIDGLLRLLALHGDRHVSMSSYSKGIAPKGASCRRAAPQPRSHPPGRTIFGPRCRLGAGAAESHPGAGGSRQSGAIQLS